MTLENLKKATMIAIKKPRANAVIDPTEVDALKLTLKITSDSLQFNGIYIPPPRSDIVVDWGDGTVGPAVFNNLRLLHTYAAPGVYQVTIWGNTSNMQFLQVNALISIDSPFPNTMLRTTTLGQLFAQCPNLIQLPEKLLANTEAVTLAEDCFWHCHSLLMLPDDILAYNPNLTDASGFAANCKHLKKIPGSLFSNCPNLFDASYIVTYSEIEEIPANLFSNNPLLYMVVNGFYSNSKLKTVPATLFQNNPDLWSVDGLFAYCTGLISLPSGLFANSNHVVRFDNMCQQCTALTNIPADLFGDQVSDEVLWFDSTFEGCTSLTAIPATLFQSVPDGARFHRTFKGCSGIVGPVPRLWETHPSSYGSECFRGCVNASNFSDIPSSWR